MTANTQKPQTLRPDFDAIPEELKQRDQWVLWRWQLRKGGKNSGLKWTKPPYQASGRAAKSNDDTTWDSFERVKAAYLRGGFDGVGFCLSAHDGLTGLDLDHCLNASLDIIKPEAEAIIRQFAGTYVERSPSGDGIRIFCAGKAPRSGKAPGRTWVEVYTYPSHRYLTVTGRPLLAGGDHA